jgi:Response regulator of the LytR/AlgR family
MNTNFDLSQEFSFKTVNGFDFFTCDKIVRFKADGDFSLVYELHKENPVRVLLTFKDLEEKISECNCFFKCHRSHIINVWYILHFVVKTNTIVMVQGEVPLAETYADDFKDRFCR